MAVGGRLAGHGEPGLRQGAAVVGLAGILRGDGHGPPVHGQRTVGVGDVITSCDIHTGSVFDDGRAGHVVALARNGLAAGDGHALDAVTLRQHGIGIAALRQRRAVIRLRVAVGGDGQRLPRHFQHTVGIGDIVAAGHIRASGVPDHGAARHVGALPCDGLAAGDCDALDAVTLRQHGIGIAALCQRRAVIRLRVAVGGDGQRLPRHFQHTVGIGDIVAAGHIRASGVPDHGAARHVGALPCDGLAAGDCDALDAVTLRQHGIGIAALCQRRAVIHFRVAVGGDGHGFAIDGQRTIGVGDVVAVGHVSVTMLDESNAGHVIAAAEHGLAAGDGHGFDGIPGCQRRVGIAVLCQRRAVVGLRVAVGGDGHGFAIDGQPELLASDSGIGSISRSDSNRCVAGHLDRHGARRRAGRNRDNILVVAGPRPYARADPRIRDRSGQREGRIAICLCQRDPLGDAHARVGPVREGHGHVHRGVFVVGGADGHGEGNGIAYRAARDIRAHHACVAHRKVGDSHAAGFACRTRRIGLRPGIGRHKPGHGGGYRHRGKGQALRHILQRPRFGLSNGEGRGVRLGQLVVARLVAGQRSGRSGVARARVGLLAGDGCGNRIAVHRPRHRDVGGLCIAVEGQRCGAPIQPDFLLLNGQLAGDKADIIVAGGQATGRDGIGIAHIAILLIAVGIGQLTAEHARCLAAHEVGIGHAVIRRGVAVGDGHVPGGDSQRGLADRDGRGAGIGLVVGRRDLVIHGLGAVAGIRDRRAGVQVTGAFRIAVFDGIAAGRVGDAHGDAVRLPVIGRRHVRRGYGHRPGGDRPDRGGGILIIALAGDGHGIGVHNGAGQAAGHIVVGRCQRVAVHRHVRHADALRLAVVYEARRAQCDRRAGDGLRRDVRLHARGLGRQRIVARVHTGQGVAGEGHGLARADVRVVKAGAARCHVHIVALMLAVDGRRPRDGRVRRSVVGLVCRAEAGDDDGLRRDVRGKLERFIRLLDIQRIVIRVAKGRAADRYALAAADVFIGESNGNVADGQPADRRIVADLLQRRRAGDGRGRAAVVGLVLHSQAGDVNGRLVNGHRRHV